MDLWLKCIIGGRTIKVGNIYRILDIDPIKGNVLVLNDKGNECWFRESRFKAVGKDDIMKNKKFKPFDIRIDINDNVLSFEICNMDINLPEMKSFNEFIGLDNNPFGVDLIITKKHEAIKLLFEDGETEAPDGVYKSNEIAIRAAFNIINTVELYNSFLEEKVFQTEKGYEIRFSPNGKDYIFRSDYQLKIGDTVICKSSDKEQYGVVHNTLDLLLEDWKSRNYCTLY
jgi:hypothetical protein